MAEKISVKLTQEVRLKDGTTWPKNTRLDNTSRQELNARGIPDTVYEVIGENKQPAPAQTPAKKN